MSLNKKTLLIIGAVSLCLILFLLVTLQVLQNRITAQQEKIEVQSHLEMVMRLLQKEIELLDILTTDWAYWDDTYDFIGDGNVAYIESNLIFSTFEILQLDYMVFADVSGEIIFARGFDWEMGREMDLPPRFMEYIFPDGPFTSQACADSGIRGLAAIPGNPMLASARPILRSDDTGPARGSLVFARRLNQTVVHQLSDLAGAMPLFFDPLNGAKPLSPSLARAGQLLSGEKFYTNPLSRELKAGYTAIRDIHGKDSLLLTIHTSREIYKFARMAERITGTLILLVGLVFASTMVILLKRNVITRLEKLNRDVKQVGSDQTFSGRVGDLPGGDELTALSAEINKMLTKLEQSQQALNRQLEIEKQTAAELLERGRLQQLLMKLATDFINISPAKLDITINEMLETIGRFTGMDRVYIFMHDFARKITSNTYEWCEDDVNPQINNLQAVPFRLIEDVLEACQQGEIFHLPNVEMLPGSREFYSHLQQQNIKSLVVFPLMQKAVNIGFVGFDAVKGIRAFTETERSLLRILTEIISNALQRQQAEAETVRVETLQAMENERTRLARELHDELGMLLYTLKLDLQMFKPLLTAADRQLQEKLGESIARIDEVIANVRNKSAFLRPPALDVLGLIKVVKNLVEQMNRQTGMKTWLRADAETAKFTPEVENTLYRCIQEGMTNAARHASAANLNIELSWDNTKVNCSIRDDGTGFDLNNLKTNPSGYLGLQGMKERVFLVRGTFEIKSAPGEGTGIYITIPLRQKVRSE